MLTDIISGNAKNEGSEFRFWIVGRIEEWCRENDLPFDAKKFGLRNSANIEVKWGMYKKGDRRDEWAACSDKTAMSILIRGDFTFTFRQVDNNEVTREVRLMNEGDYVIWREDVEHTWRMAGDSEILTLRWSPTEQESHTGNQI